MATMTTMKDRSTNKAMRLYLKEISKIPLLTVDEEKELGRRVKAGDKDAVQKLVESNLRFVITIAKKFRPSGLPFLDLINEGNCGLIEAANRFDPDRGVRFTSYAVWWIRQAILHYLSRASHAFRISPKAANIAYRVAKVLSKNKADAIDPPTGEKLAEEVGVSLNELNSSLDANAPSFSLDRPFDEAGELTLSDVLAQMTIPSAEQDVMASFLKDKLNLSLESLSVMEEKILRLRFGLDDDTPLTLREIG